MVNNESHKHLMNYAIKLAAKNLGKTGENPSVGAVITNDKNQILSVGVTGENGSPHAEFVALESLKKLKVSGNLLKLFVTLEPCNHYGKNPPCIELIRNSHIKEVYIACIDQNPLMKGKSIQILQSYGVAVTEGLLSREALPLYEGFFKRHNDYRPKISLKIAMSQNGKITVGLQGGVITTGEACKFGNYLRHRYDAIIIGKNTLLHDNPQLNCRIQGLEKFSPIKVILWGKHKIDINFDQFKISESKQKVIIFASVLGKKVSENVEILPYVNLHETLKVLATKGISSVLVEGGASLYKSFLKEDLVDDIHLFQNSSLFVDEGLSAFEKDLPSCFKMKSHKEFSDTNYAYWVKNLFAC